MRFASIIAVGATVVSAAACSSDSGGAKSPTTAASSPTAPATDDIGRRIDAILADGGPSFGEFNRDELRRMVTVEHDAPCYMVNFIKFRQFAKYPDGHDATISGLEANNRYNVLPILLESALGPCVSPTSSSS